ncbi:twin-arginine translocation signal domain-containing protein [Nostoc sp. DSM 114167]|jgi:secreted PhoX family phosphatase|uniref:twin-arginine translocation signal domain-containing protein n=1 Tax=Nostoc sp. DSM 114167 TaxID=3439050 RepID=UPI0040454B1B
MEISRRSLLKTASASGLVAAGLAVSEGFLQPLLAQTELNQIISLHSIEKS